MSTVHDLGIKSKRTHVRFEMNCTSLYCAVPCKQFMKQTCCGEAGVNEEDDYPCGKLGTV